MNKTYVMFKPDAIERKLVGEIISRIEKKGYHILAIKAMYLTQDILQQHYAHITDKPFYPDLVDFMTSGPVWGLVVEGENAIEGMRILIGDTKFEDAKAGTIRGDFATTTTKNVIHASDSEETAQIEIERFFK